MSRTDVHRPWIVQINDPYNRHRMYYYQIWPWKHEWVLLYRSCGCDMCTERVWRKQERRRQRAEGKRQCRNWEE